MERSAAMHAEPAKWGRMWCLRLDPGEDLLIALQRVATNQGVRDGVFLGAIGSLRSYHVHVVSSTDLPPENSFMKGEGAYDILSITGFVFAGRVHAHLTFSDTEKAMGGHLEEGCHVLTFAMVTLAETLDTDMANWDRVGPLRSAD
jgi:predicted DNA-binding protein with PD1-like motif